MNQAHEILVASINHSFRPTRRDEFDLLKYAVGFQEAVRDSLIFDHRLPRQSGKTAAILAEAGPGDVVVVPTKFQAGQMSRRFQTNGIGGVLVLSRGFFDGCWSAGLRGTFLSHCFFFDEIADAANISVEIAETLYSALKGNSPSCAIPSFFSLRS